LWFPPQRTRPHHPPLCGHRATEPDRGWSHRVTMARRLRLGTLRARVIANTIPFVMDAGWRYHRAVFGARLHSAQDGEEGRYALHFFRSAPELVGFPSHAVQIWTQGTGECAGRARSGASCE